MICVTINSGRSGSHSCWKKQLYIRKELNERGQILREDWKLQLSVNKKYILNKDKLGRERKLFLSLHIKQQNYCSQLLRTTYMFQCQTVLWYNFICMQQFQVSIYAIVDECMQFLEQRSYSSAKQFYDIFLFVCHSFK